MTQVSATSTKLRRFIKWTLISLVLVACIWLAVIAWWQDTQRVITLQDTLVYLLILPAAVLSTMAVLVWLHGRKARMESASKSAALPGSVPDQDGQLLARERASTLPILAAWGVTGVADNAPDLIQALHEKRHRPQPDASLRDGSGYPLHAMRVKQLDTDSVQESLARMIAMQGITALPDANELRESFVRSLALLSRILDQVSSDWPLAFETAGTARAIQVPGTLRGAEAPAPAMQNSLALQVKLLMPLGFQPAERQLALAFLLEKTGQLHPDPQCLQVEAVAAQDDAAVLNLADQFRIASLHASQPQALLLLACESTLCSTVAEQWQAAGKLFSNGTPNGLMMGEAAFAVLCVNDKALPLAVSEAACRLSGVANGRRESSADIPGKPSSLALSAVIGGTLANAGISGEKIGSVACDADHRTSRVLECIGAMMQHLPQLDAIDNRLATNETCGHTGAASVAGGLVAGILQVREAGYPVLVFNVSHLFDRAAAVLMPTDEAQQPS